MSDAAHPEPTPDAGAGDAPSAATKAGNGTPGNGKQGNGTPGNGKPAAAHGAATPPAEPADDLVTTRHTFVGDHGSFDYTATIGRVVLREDVVTDGVYDGRKPKAEVSITAYVREHAQPRTRPVVFAFNGGPGSSSVWLHLGLLGPRLAVSGDAGRPAGPPFALRDNHQSLLAVADLVFIDPVSTGWSRTTTGGAPKDFHGFTPDIASVGEVIRAWVTANGRWLSPKLLLGESYGTTRASALAEHLQRVHAMYLNGVALISSVLDLGSVEQDFRNDRAYPLFLPTYAATAHFHGKHPDRTLAEVVAEAEAYAERDYPWALARGNRLTATERAEHVATLARLTGLSPAYVDRANLRVEHIRFFTELLRDQGLATGRIDTRFTGPLGDGNAATFDADPFMDAVTGAYAAAFNHYVRDELGYTTELPYRTMAPIYEEWSYKEFEASRSTCPRPCPGRCGPTRTCRSTSATATTTAPPRTSPRRTCSPTSTSPPSSPTTSSTATTRRGT